MLFETGISKNFAIFTGKHFYWGFSLNNFFKYFFVGIVR